MLGENNKEITKENIIHFLDYDDDKNKNRWPMKEELGNITKEQQILNSNDDKIQH